MKSHMKHHENIAKVDFYFDFISPYSYFAAMQLGDIAEKYAVEFAWLPVNLPKLIKQSGNVPLVSIKNKAIYSLRDLKRWATHLNLPFKMIRPGAFDSRPALRIASALQGEQRHFFCLAVFEALWSGDINPKDADWLQQVFAHKQLPHAWLDLSSDGFEIEVQKSVKAGLFGVPSFVLHGKGRSELFFGLDHMDFLLRACQKSDKGCLHD